MTERSPSQPPTLSRRSFITGLIGVGAALGIPGCAPKSTDTLPTTISHTTVKDSVPTTQHLPDSTSSSTQISTTSDNPTTSEAPSTTTSERVFASPEQKMRVEAVETNIENFFKLVKQDVIDYRKTTDFTPYVSGISTIKIYPSPNDDSYRMLGVNLGTLPVQTGDTTCTLETLGFVTNQGDAFVQFIVQDINDPEFLQHVPGIKSNAGAVTIKPIGHEGDVTTYGVDSKYMSNDYEVPSKKVVGTENLTAALDTPEAIGLPVIAEYFTNTSEQAGGTGYVIEPSPALQSIIKDLNTAATQRKLDEALTKYTPEELASVGVISQTGNVPDSLLKFASLPELLSVVPYGSVRVFLDNIAPII